MAMHLAHRGLIKKKLSENTIISFKESFKKGYGIETDIHFTKDNKIVCFHDFSLKNKFKINKKISELNYDLLRKISLKFNSEIPLLDDLLKIIPNKFHLTIELKPFFPKKNLISLINKTKKCKNFSLTSFNEKNLINLYKLRKTLNLGMIFPYSIKMKQLKNKLKKKYIKLLVIDKKFLRYSEIDKFKVSVYYYTIKNKKIFNKYKYLKNLIFEDS